MSRARRGLRHAQPSIHPSIHPDEGGHASAIGWQRLLSFQVSAMGAIVGRRAPPSSPPGGFRGRHWPRGRPAGRNVAGAA